MRRLFTLSLTLMLALAMQAQTTVSFMGVPVKGTPESFRQQLLMKGCYTDKNSVLKGVVDGALSTIIINESNNQVKSVTAIEDEQLIVLKELAERSKLNGVEVKLLNKEEVLKLEPNINPEVKGALYAPTAGVIDPFNLVVHAMENAIDNGATFLRNHEVKDIKNLYVGGDGAGLTRGLAQAGACGVYVARNILEKKGAK